MSQLVISNLSHPYTILRVITNWAISNLKHPDTQPEPCLGRWTGSDSATVEMIGGSSHDSWWPTQHSDDALASLRVTTELGELPMVFTGHLSLCPWLHSPWWTRRGHVHHQRTPPTEDRTHGSHAPNERPTRRGAPPMCRFLDVPGFTDYGTDGYS